MIKETYNLIILDRSGSMSSIRNQAIAGVNETLGTIRHLENSTDVRQFVSLASFCSCNLNKTYECTPVAETKPFTKNDYEPCCCTPLYDAIGICCTDLKKKLASKKDYAVSVTIITDGYENASKEWTVKSIRTLIESLKADGWLFAYIGANQDLEKVSYSLSIDNTMNFVADEAGTYEMFKRERKARSRWMENLTCCEEIRPECNQGYFE